jgi:hypothetical protein
MDNKVPLSGVAETIFGNKVTGIINNDNKIFFITLLS